MKPGTVYNLTRGIEGISPGTYILVEDPIDSAEVIMCLAGEDENGDICTTEHEVEIHRDFVVCELFRPVFEIESG